MSVPSSPAVSYKFTFYYSTVQYMLELMNELTLLVLSIVYNCGIDCLQESVPPVSSHYLRSLEINFNLRSRVTVTDTYILGTLHSFTLPFSSFPQGLLIKNMLKDLYQHFFTGVLKHSVVTINKFVKED